MDTTSPADRLSGSQDGAMPKNVYVVTGAGRGVGRAICERLLRDGHGVVAVDVDDESLAWVTSGRDRPMAAAIPGDAADEALARSAADTASQLGMLSGWVNNAAIFDDLSIETAGAHEIAVAIHANLNPALVGSSVAAKTWLARQQPGSIVNVSSHQAQRAVRGALAYSTAKAAIEGLTRALAVDLGPSGIRVNAVALGSISTQRYESYLAALPDTDRALVDKQMARLHPLGRVGTSDEVAAVVAFLLSDEARFVSGTVVPIDGGRSAQGQDPESAD